MWSLISERISCGPKIKGHASDVSQTVFSFFRGQKFVNQVDLYDTVYINYISYRLYQPYNMVPII